MDLNKPKVAALGDSITAGYLCEEENSWVAITADELDIEIVNLGVCGDLSSDLLKRAPRLMDLGAACCIILCGTNDAFYDIRLKDFSRNITAIIKLLQENNITPIIGIPTPCLTFPEEALLREYRDWLKIYAEEKSLWIVDFYLALVDRKGETSIDFFLDEVHPNRQGYKLMAEEAKKILAEIIKANKVKDK